MPTKATAIVYRELLQRIWVLDPLPAWVPVFASLKALGQADDQPDRQRSFLLRRPAQSPPHLT